MMDDPLKSVTHSSIRRAEATYQTLSSFYKDCLCFVAVQRLQYCLILINDSKLNTPVAFNQRKTLNNFIPLIQTGLCEPHLPEAVGEVARL